ncbi:MAG TPA: radical SAM protein [Flavitalea sp.]|nr:radical SAM protein [Flavitalea sp.]
MEESTVTNESVSAAVTDLIETKKVVSEMQILKGWKRKWIELKVGLHILQIAIKNYHTVSQSIKALQGLYQLKKSVLGAIQTKIIKLNGRYYHYLYAPGYPSKAFDKYIEAELHRIIPISKKTNRLTFIIFAITKKCPLQCEHCLEWNNLNKSESFTLNELKAVLSRFETDGISQFHLSGGEPMVRIKDLEQLVRYGSRDSEFYVLTSGFNFTIANAKLLKNAGLTGVIISLDHFDPQIHNSFRGFKNSFQDVIKAVHIAHEFKLLITLSICVTRSFVNWDNLIEYAKLAKQLDVAYIQLLEPKAVGHYAGQDVSLQMDQLDMLNNFYQTLNFDPAYADYPIVVYHGYHQRTVGCFSAGNRMLYIDSEGYVNACPFCHTKNFNIRDAINEDPSNENKNGMIVCPRFETPAV